jgi:hypothetical protein
MPFYIYLSIFSKFVKVFSKLLFLTIRLSQAVPVVGPKIGSLLTWVTHLSLFSWVLTYKED